jgi:hypothetical protein
VCVCEKNYPNLKKCKNYGHLRYRSQTQNPDPFQNVLGPEHWLQELNFDWLTFVIIVRCVGSGKNSDLYVLDPVCLVDFGEELCVGDGDDLMEPEPRQ